MNCAEHIQAPAVAQCNSCQRGLCNECADAYNPPTCSICVAGTVANEKSDAIKQLAIMGGLFLLGMWMGNGLASDPKVAPPYPPYFTTLLMGYVVASVPSGWRALTRITSRIFLFLPLIGWVFYFVYKLAVSATIGPFILPFKLWSLLRLTGLKRGYAFGTVALLVAVLLAAVLLVPPANLPPGRIAPIQGGTTSGLTPNVNPPSAASMSVLPGAIILDELNGSSVGLAHGVQWTHALGGRGAVFTAAGSSRIEYPNNFPKEGTIELWIRVDAGYRYENGTFRPNQDDAMIFATDVVGGDVTWPGTAKLIVSKNGDISFWMATTKGEQSPGRTLARATKLRFGEWHAIGVSYGSQGQSIMMDGILVASELEKTQSLGSAGNQTSPLDVPTVGETLSHFWSTHQWDGGFEGILGRFRASPKQHDWFLSKEVPPDSAPKSDLPPQVSAVLIPNIEGNWALHNTNTLSPSAALTVTIYAQEGPGFSIRGDGWSGTGSIRGDSGYYDWAFANGARGRTSFTVASDGTLQGQVKDQSNNPGLNWSFVAKRIEPGNHDTALEQPKDSKESGLGSVGEVLRAGENGVSNVLCVYCPNPDYSDEARKAKFAGEVLLEITVLPNGKATNIRVIKSPGMGLDEKAIEAMRKWKFKPAISPNGQPVAAITQIHVYFQL